jgi:hypothetical protein
MLPGPFCISSQATRAEVASGGSRLHEPASAVEASYMRRSWSVSTLLLGGISLAAAAAMAAIYGTVLFRIATNAYGSTGDFLSFYAAGFLVRTGRAAHLYDPSTIEWAQRRLYPGGFDEAIGYPLPVFVALLFAPLSMLPFTASFFLFMGAMAGVLTIVLIVLRRYLADVPPLPRNVFLLCAAISMPSVASIVFGQVDLLPLTGLTGGYLLLRSNRPRSAGIALCLALFKPHLILGAALVLLVRREWRALQTLAAVGIPLLVLPALFTAPSALIDNLKIIASYPGSDRALSVNAAVMPNWRGFMVSATNSNELWYWLPGLALIASVALSSALYRWRSAGFDQSYAIATLLPLYLSPHVHTQNLVLLILPAAILLRAYLAESDTKSRRLQAVNALLAAYVILFILPIVAIIGLSLTVFPMLGLYAAVVTRWPLAASETQVARNASNDAEARAA